MPTNNFTRTAGLMPLRALPILGAEFPRPNLPVISVFSAHCLAGQMHRASFFASGTFTANTALALPFTIAHPFLIRKIFWGNGATATTDSVDVGVYNANFGLVVATGSTSVTGANATQEVDVTDTLIKPGVYYFAFVQNGTTFTPIGGAFGTTQLRGVGAVQMSSGAFPLPSTFVPETLTLTRAVLVGIASRTLAS